MYTTPFSDTAICGNQGNLVGEIQTETEKSTGDVQSPEQLDGSRRSLCVAEPSKLQQDGFFKKYTYNIIYIYIHTV